MMTTRMLSLLSLCLLGLPACKGDKPGNTSKAGNTTAPAGELTDPDREAIRATIAKFDQSVVAQDWKTAGAVYTDDAILLPPNAPEVRGRDAIQKFLQGFPKMTVFKEQVEEISGDADLAYPRGTYETSFIPKGAKTPVNEKGKVLAVWHKQPDGSWRVSRVIWNSDLPPGKM